MTGCQWTGCCVCVRICVCVCLSPGSPGCVRSPGFHPLSCTSPPPLPSSCIRLRTEELARLQEGELTITCIYEELPRDETMSKFLSLAFRYGFRGKAKKRFFAPSLHYIIRSGHYSIDRQPHVVDSNLITEPDAAFHYVHDS